MTIRAHSTEFNAYNSSHINQSFAERMGEVLPSPHIPLHMVTIMDNFKCRRCRRFTRNSIICGQCHQCNYSLAPLPAPRHLLAHSRTHPSPPPPTTNPKTNPIKSCHSLLLLLPFCQCLFSLILLCSAISFHSISIRFSCAQTLLTITFHVQLLPLVFFSSYLYNRLQARKNVLKNKKKKMVSYTSYMYAYMRYYVYMYIVGINLQHFHGFPCAICH